MPLLVLFSAVQGFAQQKREGAQEAQKEHNKHRKWVA
jgi:hypothetical protein